MGTATPPATLAAPAAGTPTALVPVTGVDLTSDAAQQRVLLDVAIVGIGLALLVFGILLRTGKKSE